MEGLCARNVLSSLSTRGFDTAETALANPPAPGSRVGEIMLIGLAAIAAAGAFLVGIVVLSVTADVIVIPVLAVVVIVFGGGAVYSIGPSFDYVPLHSRGWSFIPSWGGYSRPSYSSYASPSFFGGNSWSRPMASSPSSFFGGGTREYSPYSAGSSGGLRVVPGMRGILA